MLKRDWNVSWCYDKKVHKYIKKSPSSKIHGKKKIKTCVGIYYSIEKEETPPNVFTC